VGILTPKFFPLGGRFGGEVAPNKKHDDGPNHGADKACSFASVVPAKGLAEIGRHKRTSDAKQCRENKTRWFIGWLLRRLLILAKLMP
jgi:hypothetical protein